MSLLAIAGLALEAGPALIRGISSMFGGSETAEKVAKAVETVDKMTGTSSKQKKAVLEGELGKLSPDELIELNRLKVELENQVTRRIQIAAQARQSEHQETQTTIRNGDQSKNWVVVCSRPAMALVSAISASAYVLTNPDPKLDVAAFLIGLAATYMGLRHREKDKGIANE